MNNGNTFRPGLYSVRWGKVGRPGKAWSVTFDADAWDKLPPNGPDVAFWGTTKTVPVTLTIRTVKPAGSAGELEE